jgi:hypothetical protein
MVALGPDNMKWRMEQQYADANLGIVLYDQRRFSDAAAQFAEALTTIEAISTADPGNRDYRKSIAESLAWLADAQRASGHYQAAISARERDIAVLEALLAATGDVDYRQRLIPARRMLGILYAEQGQSALAIQQFRAAVDQADILVPKEPKNSLWLEYGYKARIDLARQLLLAGQRAEAAVLAHTACQTVAGLLVHDARKPEWRIGLTRCWMLQAALALAAGTKGQALSFAQRAVAVAKTVDSGNATADAFLLANADRMVGDAQRAMGDGNAARSAWADGLALVPRGVAEQPDELAIHAAILERLERIEEAQQLQARLGSMGYRQIV